VSYFAVEEPSLDCVVFQSPNDEFFPAGRNLVVGRQRHGQLSDARRLSISGIPTDKNGYTGSAPTFSARPTRMAAPPSCRSGNTMLRVEPYGSQRLSAQNILKPQGQQGFKLGAGRGSISTWTSSTC